MILRRIIPPQFVRLLLAGLHVFALGQVGTWSSIPTLTEIRDIHALNEDLLIASNGGILTFDVEDSLLHAGVFGTQIENLDLSSIQVDAAGLIWVGGRSPGPIVEVIDPGSLTQYPVEYVDLDEVTSFVDIGDSVFATYKNDLEGGLLLYRKVGMEIQYLDLFNNFPTQAGLDLSAADNVVLVDDRLVFHTQKYLLWASTNSTNLKDPAVWELVRVPEVLSVSMIQARGNDIIVAGDQKLFRYDFSDFELIHTANSQLLDFELPAPETAQLIYLSGSGIFELDLDNGSFQQRLSKSGLKHVALTSGAIWLAHSSDFLAHYSDDAYVAISANRPGDHIFSQMIVNSHGELVAAGNLGINIHNELGWRTIKAGNANSAFDEEHYDWSRFISDTLNYPGHSVVEDMVADEEGRLYLSIQGKGVLKLDTELPGASTFYNATDDVLEPTYDSDTYILPTQIAVDGSNNVWMTTKYIRDDGHALTILTPDGMVYHIDQSAQGLDTRAAKSIAIDDQDMIWVGSQVITDLQQGGGIHLIRKTGEFGGQWDIEVSTLRGSPLASNDILQLEIDHNNTLWILTPAGVQSMQLPAEWKNSNELRSWASLYMTLNSDSYYYWQLTDYNVTRIEIDPRGNHWFLSSNAGVHVLLENGRWINGGYGYSTGNSELLDNQIYSVAFNQTTGETYFSTPKGISVLNTPFADPREDYSSIHVYPQPFNPDVHEKVIIQGLMDNSSVKILTVAGRMIRELTSQKDEVRGFEAQWDGRDSAGDKVQSGVYILFLFNEDGGATSHKIAVLR